MIRREPAPQPVPHPRPFGRPVLGNVQVCAFRRRFVGRSQGSAVSSADSMSSILLAPQVLDTDGESVRTPDEPAVFRGVSPHVKFVPTLCCFQKGNKFPELSTHALVEQLRSRVDALQQVAHKTGLSSLIAAVAPVPDLLQELLTRWRASTTLALNTVSKLEEEFRGQREAHAACKLECEELRRQLAASGERTAAVDDLSELRQAVKEGAQSDRVRSVCQRLWELVTWPQLPVCGV
jgi:hypothetical protein